MGSLFGGGGKKSSPAPAPVVEKEVETRDLDQARRRPAAERKEDILEAENNNKKTLLGE